MFTSVKAKLAPVFAALFVAALVLLNSPIAAATCSGGASGGCVL
jgi:hypothetical protein